MATGRYQSSGSIRSIDRLNRLWYSLPGCSNGRRLVLVTVVWFWRWPSPTCLPTCLPAYLPACPCQCLIQFRGGVGPIEGSDLFESFSMGVRWLYIQTVVVWGASLGGLDSIRFGNGLISRLWFNSIDRLNRSWCSLASRSNADRSNGSGDGRLVLATVEGYY